MQYFEELNYDDIKIPMAVTDIDEFERMNGLIINVYGCTEDGKEIYSSKKRGNAINLLMLENGEAYHYVLIKILNGLFRSCADGNNTKEFCPYCCHGFDKGYTDDEKMEEHMGECFTNKGAKVKMTKVGENEIEFNQYYEQQVAPYCIYADFESVLKKESENKTLYEILDIFSV